MMKKILPFLAVGLMWACQPPKRDPGKQTDEPMYITDEAFSQDPFGFPPTADNFQKRFPNLKATAEPVENIHVPGQVDTIYHLSDGKIDFEIYRARSNDLLQKAHISSEHVVLKGNIKVGMNRQELSDALGVELKGQKFTVGDEGQFSYWTFTLENDKLVEMAYSGYVD